MVVFFNINIMVFDIYSYNLSVRIQIWYPFQLMYQLPEQFLSQGVGFPRPLSDDNNNIGVCNIQMSQKTLAWLSDERYSSLVDFVCSFHSIFIWCYRQFRDGNSFVFRYNDVLSQLCTLTTAVIVHKSRSKTTMN